MLSSKRNLAEQVAEESESTVDWILLYLTFYLLTVAIIAFADIRKVSSHAEEKFGPIVAHLTPAMTVMIDDDSFRPTLREAKRYFFKEKETIFSFGEDARERESELKGSLERE